MTRKSVLITGASAGIGAASARLLARAGYDVGVGYRTDLAGAEAAAADVEAAGQRAVLLPGDVASPDQIEQIFAGFDAAFPRMDALVNNAGIVGDKASVVDMTPDRIARIMAVNVTGALLVAQGAVRRMLADGAGGAIVNMSSAAARLGSPNQYVDYAASKAAVDTMTQGLSLEVAASGIRVNAIRPGVIETEIHAKGGEPDRAARLAPTLPMARAGTATEVAEAVVWLLSDQASYVTGTIVDVSGGR